MFRRPRSGFKFNLSSPARSFSLVSDSSDEDIDFMKSRPKCFIAGGSRFTNMKLDASFFEHSKSGLARIFSERIDNFFKKERTGFEEGGKGNIQKSGKNNSQKSIELDSMRLAVLKDSNKGNRCQRYIKNQPCSSNCSKLHTLPKDEGVVCKYFYFYLQCDERCIYSHTERCSEASKKAYFDQWASIRCQNLLKKSQCLSSCDKIHRYPKEDGVYCSAELTSSCKWGPFCRYLHIEDSSYPDVNEMSIFSSVYEPSKSKERSAEYYLPEHGTNEVNVLVTEHSIPQNDPIYGEHSSFTVINEHSKNTCENFPNYVRDLRNTWTLEAGIKDCAEESSNDESHYYFSNSEESSEEEDSLLCNGIGSTMEILKGGKYKQAAQKQHENKSAMTSDSRNKPGNSDKNTYHTVETSLRFGCSESKGNKSEHRQLLNRNHSDSNEDRISHKKESKNLSSSILRCNVMEDYYRAYESDYYETSVIKQSRNETDLEHDIHSNSNNTNEKVETELAKLIKRKEHKLCGINDIDRLCISRSDMKSKNFSPATEVLGKWNMVQEPKNATLEISETQNNTNFVGKSSDTCFCENANKTESLDVGILNSRDVKDEVDSQSCTYPEDPFILSPQNTWSSPKVKSSCSENEREFSDDENEMDRNFNVNTQSPTELHNANEINVEDYIISSDDDSGSDYENPRAEGKTQQKEQLLKTQERECQSTRNIGSDTKESSSNKQANKYSENIKDSSTSERPSNDKVFGIKMKTSDINTGSENLSQEMNVLHLVSQVSESSMDIKQDNNCFREIIASCPNVNNFHNTDLYSSKLKETFQEELNDHGLREIKLVKSSQLVLSGKEIKTEVLKVEVDDQDCIVIRDSDEETEHISVDEKQETVANIEEMSRVKRGADNSNNLCIYTPLRTIHKNFKNREIVAQRKSTQLTDSSRLEINDSPVFDKGERKIAVIIASCSNIEKNLNESFAYDTFLSNSADHNSSEFENVKVHYNNNNDSAVESERILLETPDSIQEMTNKSTSENSHTDVSLNRDFFSLENAVIRNNTFVGNISRNVLDIIKINESSCIDVSCNNLKKELNDESGTNLVDSDLNLSCTKSISRNLFQNENTLQQPSTISPSFQVVKHERVDAYPEQIAVSVPFVNLNGIHSPLNNSVALPAELTEGPQDKEKEQCVRGTVKREVPAAFKNFLVLPVKEEVIEPYIVVSDDEDVILISDDDSVSESVEPSFIEESLYGVSHSTGYRYGISNNLCKDILPNTMQKNDIQKSIVVSQNLELNSANSSLEMVRGTLPCILNKSEHVTDFMNIGSLRANILNEPSDSRDVSLSTNLRTNILNVSLPQSSQLFQNTTDMKVESKCNSSSKGSNKEINSLESDTLTKEFPCQNIKNINASINNIISEGDEVNISLLQEFLTKLQGRKVLKANASNLCVQDLEYKNSSITDKETVSSEILNEPGVSLQNLATTSPIQNDCDAEIRGPLSSASPPLCELGEFGVTEKGDGDEEIIKNATERLVYSLRNSTNTETLPYSQEMTDSRDISLKKDKLNDFECESLSRNHPSSGDYPSSNKITQVQEMSKARDRKMTSSEDPGTLEGDEKYARLTSQQESSDKVHAVTSFGTDSPSRHKNDTAQNITETKDFRSENIINGDRRNAIMSDLSSCSNEKTKSFKVYEKFIRISANANTKVQSAQYTSQDVNSLHQTEISRIKIKQNDNEGGTSDIFCSSGDLVCSEEQNRNTFAGSGIKKLNKREKFAYKRSCSALVNTTVSSKGNSIINTFKERSAVVANEEVVKSTLSLCKEDASVTRGISGLYAYKCDGDDSGKAGRPDTTNSSSEVSTEVLEKINLEISDSKCQEVVPSLSFGGKCKKPTMLKASLVDEPNDKNLLCIDESGKSGGMSDNPSARNTACKGKSHTRPFSSFLFRKSLTEGTNEKFGNDVGINNSSKSEIRLKNCSVILEKICDKKVKMKKEFLPSTKTFELRSKFLVDKDSQKILENKSTRRITEVNSLRAETEFLLSGNDRTQKTSREDGRRPVFSQTKLLKSSVTERKKDKKIFINLRPNCGRRCEEKSNEKGKELDVAMSLTETDKGKDDTHSDVNKSGKVDLKNKNLKKIQSNSVPKEKIDMSKLLDFNLITSNNTGNFLNQITDSQSAPMSKIPNPNQGLVECKTADGISVSADRKSVPHTRSHSVRMKEIQGKNFNSNNNCISCREVSKSVGKFVQQTESPKREHDKANESRELNKTSESRKRNKQMNLAIQFGDIHYKTNESRKRKIDNTNINVATKTPRKDGSIHLQF